MTKHEAQVAHASGQLTLMALNANQYADRFPAKAAKAAQRAEAYADWLNANGRQVELGAQEVNGLRRFMVVTIDGKTWIRNGVFVNDPAAR